MYSDNGTVGSDEFLQGKNSLEGLLPRNNVKLAFSGHAHTYQRNKADGKDGLPNYVTGGGGAKVEPIGDRGCSKWDVYGIGWSYSRSAGSRCGSAPVAPSLSQGFHFLLVTVNGTQITVKPTDSTGRTFDVVTYK